MYFSTTQAIVTPDNLSMVPLLQCIELAHLSRCVRDIISYHHVTRSPTF
jgi:hypothetical protein